MDEAQIVGGMILKARQDPAVVLQPGKQALDFPPAAIPAQGSSILGRRPFAVALMRGDHLNAKGRKAPVQRITVIRPISNQPVGPSGGETPGESGVDQGDFMRCSRCRVDGDRKTMAVCHRRELGTFVPLGCSHVPSVFFAPMKVASMKHSLRSTSPRVRKSSAKVSNTLRRTPVRTHCWKRRWQVWYGGNRSGKSCQRAPERRIHNMPLRTSRLARQGRPRPSGRRGGVGINGARRVHCSSVSSSRRAILATLPLHS